MNALKILFVLAAILYLVIYEPIFWKYFFGILIPYWLLTQVFFYNSKYNTAKRKTFISLWTHPFDPQIFATVKIDITHLEGFLKDYSQKVGREITYLNFLIKVFAKMMTKYPKINGNINFGKVYHD